jgi:hypothetical protein
MEVAMKYLSLLAVVGCGLLAACAIHERTVIERPVAQAPPVVYETPSRTVYVTPYD